jgi:integrase
MGLKGTSTTSDYLEFDATNAKALKMIRSGNDRILGFLVIVGMNTGLRIGDLLTLQYEDFENDSISIIEKKTKKKRLIRINDNIKLAFYILKINSENKTGPVFMTRLGTIYSCQYINRWLKLKFGSKKTRTSCHSMRKGMARQVFFKNNESDKALIYLSELFNHSSLAMTKKYLGIRQEELDDIYLSL